MKVDPNEARKLAHYEPGFVPDFTKHHVTRAPYNREPYVRANIDGATIDAKAIGWTSEHVHLKWQAGGDTFTRWVPASDVVRISREQSAWRDPYDERD